MSIINKCLKSPITQIAEEDTAAHKRQGQIAFKTQTSCHMVADPVGTLGGPLMEWSDRLIGSMH